jgi:hypothetical protein
MLAHFKWCISVAHCLDAQLIVSTRDPMLWSLVGPCTFGGKHARTPCPGQLTVAQLSQNRHCTH